MFPVVSNRAEVNKVDLMYVWGHVPRHKTKVIWNTEVETKYPMDVVA